MGKTAVRLRVCHDLDTADGELVFNTTAVIIVVY